MEGKPQILSNVAYMPIQTESHILPILGFLSELHVQGINLDVYGPTSMIQTILKTEENQNQFAFDELRLNDESMTEFFESFYYGFLRTVPAIEAI